MLEDIQNLTEYGSGQPALAHPAWAGEVVLGGLKSSLPISTILYDSLQNREKWLVCFMIRNKPNNSIQIWISDTWKVTIFLLQDAEYLINILRKDAD